MAAAMGFAMNRRRPNTPDADDPYLEVLFRWGDRWMPTGPTRENYNLVGFVFARQEHRLP
jgi:hypothetical protein